MGESLPDPALCRDIGLELSIACHCRPTGRRQQSRRKDETKDHLVGIDVSLESCAVCVVNQSGASVREAKVSCEPEALIVFLRELGHDPACIGLVAEPQSQWLYRHLRDAGLEAVSIETRQVKGALKATPIKTDRRNALGIEQLIRMAGSTQLPKSANMLPVMRMVRRSGLSR